MKLRGGIWMLGWVLFGLLAISAGLILLGSRERQTRPSAFSYGPSGSHALVELLRKEGIEVEVSRATRPKLAAEDLALGWLVEANVYDWDFETSQLEEGATAKALRKHLNAGGRILLLQAPLDFRDATRLAASGARHVRFALAESDKEFNLTEGSELAMVPSEMAYRTDSLGFAAAVDRDGASLLHLYDDARGMLAVHRDATGLTNRFLDREQNAEFLIWLVRMLLPSGGKVVFIEALAGEAMDPGLLASLGTWAPAAWWQLIFAFIVLAYSLGRRFGLPISQRYQQRGGRELVEAYADVLARSRKPQAALKKVVQSADREARQKFGVAADVPPKRRNEMLPDGLAQALSMAEIAVQSSLTDLSATRLAQRLEDELAAMRGEPARRRRRKRR